MGAYTTILHPTIGVAGQSSFGGQLIVSRAELDSSLNDLYINCHCLCMSHYNCNAKFDNMIRKELQKIALKCLQKYESPVSLALGVLFSKLISIILFTNSSIILGILRALFLLFPIFPAIIPIIPIIILFIPENNQIIPENNTDNRTSPVDTGISSALCRNIPAKKASQLFSENCGNCTPGPRSHGSTQQKF